MSLLKSLQFPLWLGACVVANNLSAQSPKEYDLVVYGGSSAGIAAAVQVKRMGGTVVIIEPGRRIGGLTTGGLGQTDIGNKMVIGGISREFYREVRQWYNKPEAWKWQAQPKPGEKVGTGQSVTSQNEDTLWTFEPSVALNIYEKWVKENDLEIIYNERLDRTNEAKASNTGDGYWTATSGQVAKGVEKDGAIIKTITMESGKRFHGKMFMDATYEGDLLASAGVSYTIGREGEAIYGETLNGVRQAYNRHHQFVDGVDPYVVKGDPKSGLLPHVEPSIEPDGSSDHRIQGYCFRMCLTDVDENRIPFKKPEGYIEGWYEALFRNYEQGFDGIPWINSLMPNRKTDTNNRNGFSTDFFGQNYEWPEGSYELRKEIRENHLLYQQGLMWSLAYHPRVPEKVRNVVSTWGMTKDEFVEGEGWQDQLYVREGRRMISDVVMVQGHCENKIVVEDPVGMGAYTMDSHHVQRFVDANGHLRNEGDVQVRGGRPYDISYRSIIPTKKECENLLVPIALSSSHIAFGSIRMEPVFMILGQSGATAAMQAIEAKKALQDIDFSKLKERLLADKQVLSYVPAATHNSRPLTEIKGIVVDDSKAKLSGTWIKSDALGGIHQGYQHDDGVKNGNNTAKFSLEVTEAGTYSVEIAALPNGNRSSKTPVTIQVGDQSTEHVVNQKVASNKADKAWHSVSTIEVKAGQKVNVTISNKGVDGYVIIDAVRLLKK